MAVLLRRLRTSIRVQAWRTGWCCKATSTCTENFDGEYTKPVVKTPIPGPRSQELLAGLSKIQQTGNVHFFADFHRSRGNFVVDADGNVLLDLFNQIATLPLGYNHPAVREALSTERALVMLTSRPALGFNPPLDYTQTLQDCLLSIAPDGMSEVTTMMCGSCANENAFKAAFIWYMNKQRDVPLSPDSEEYRTAIINQPPGCPKLSILSFEKGFHGRLLGSLSCSHVRPIQKLDVPAFNWPIAPFPQLKYPLEEFTRENETEERRCLEQVEDQIEKSNREGGTPIATVVVEPIQAEGGDRHASPEFFRGLQRICKKHGVAFMVDEVQTGGGATGSMWAQDNWQLSEPPDYVTFAKKFQIGGYFHLPGRRPAEPDRVANTWLGEPAKMLILDAIIKEIARNNLLGLVKESGRVLMSGLTDIQAKYPLLIHSVRGVGTFCAFDCYSTETRNKLVFNLRNRGLQISGVGDMTVRFRPALIFQPKHANMFLEGFERVLKDY